MAAGEKWSPEEVALVVEDYFRMFRLQLGGQKFNKSQHRRDLQKKLDGRSDLSVDRKHQNISAVLDELGSMWLPGFVPMKNYQALLAEEVLAQLEKPDFEAFALASAVLPAETPDLKTFSGFVVPPPKAKVKEPAEKCEFKAQARKDYVERESRNAQLGLAGERLILTFEERRLLSAGRKDLAKKIEHVSSTQGDGLGFDIASFEVDGTQRFIEVKTTAYACQTAFFMSASELRFSDCNPDAYHLYRLFDFRRKPRMFQLSGPVRNLCSLDPISYRVSVA